MRSITKKDIRLPKHKKSGHKGDNGKLLIIGGSEQYVGALVLAGLAALRSGCDWVTIAAPKKVAWAINTFSPDLVTTKLSGSKITSKHTKKLLKLSEDHDAVLLGNGIGTDKETKKFIQYFLKKVKVPVIVDADALNVIRLTDVPFGVLTPHKKELEQILKNQGFKGDPQKEATIKRLQKLMQDNVIIFKGQIDIIFSKNKVLKNKTGNVGMTKAGTGDVLAGLVSGFIAQDMPFLEAAKAAAFINGAVGDALLKRKKYYSYIASDIVNDINDVINRLRRQKT